MVKVVLSRPARVENMQALEDWGERERRWSVFYAVGVTFLFLASISYAGAVPYLNRWRSHLFLSSAIVFVTINSRQLLTFARREQDRRQTSIYQEDQQDYTGRFVEMFCSFLFTMGSLMLANSAIISFRRPDPGELQSISWQFALCYATFLVGSAANAISSKSSSSEILETRNAIIFQFVVASCLGLIGSVFDMPGVLCNEKVALKKALKSWLQGISGGLILLGAFLNYFHTQAYFEYEKCRLQLVLHKRERLEQYHKERQLLKKRGRLWLVRKFFGLLYRKRPQAQSVFEDRQQVDLSSSDVSFSYASEVTESEREIERFHVREEPYSDCEAFPISEEANSTQETDSDEYYA